jgi:HD-like signal output (HDOD) protein
MDWSLEDSLHAMTPGQTTTFPLGDPILKGQASLPGDRFNGCKSMSFSLSIVHKEDRDIDDIQIDVARMVRRDRVKIAAFPSSIAWLSRIVRSDKYTIADLVDVVSQDQVLSAYVLRYANSATYKGVEEVTRLSDAILRLGSRETLAIAVAVSLGAQVVGEGPLKPLRDLVWRRSTFAAVFCRAMAKPWGLEEDHAFLCGLLYNFGTCVALACIEQGYQPSKSTSLPAEFWMDVAQRYSEELGEVLAAKWRLPSLVVSVLAAQNDFSPDPNVAPFVSLIELASDVGELLEKTTSVESSSIATLEHVKSQEEAEYIAKLLPELPQVVYEMTPVQPAEPKNKKMARPVVLGRSKRRARTVGRTTQKGMPAIRIEPAPSSLGKTRQETRFRVIHHLASGDNEYQCTQVGENGVLVFGDVEMAENSVVKITLECDPEPITVFATVTRCHEAAKDTSKWAIEICPVALDADSKVRWDELLRASSDELKPDIAKPHKADIVPLDESHWYDELAPPLPTPPPPPAPTRVSVRTSPKPTPQPAPTLATERPLVTNPRELTRGYVTLHKDYTSLVGWSVVVLATLVALAATLGWNVL